METGSSSDSMGKNKTQKGGYKSKLGSMLPRIDPFVPRTDHNPKELRSWAKRTGFVSNFSGETTTSVSEKYDSAGIHIERGREHSGGGGSSPKIEIDPILGRTRPNRGLEIEPDSEVGNGARRNGNGEVWGFREGVVRGENERRRVRDVSVLEDKVDERLNRNGTAHADGNRIETVNGNRTGAPGAPVPVVNPVEPKQEEENVERDARIDMYPGGEETADGGWRKQSEMRFGLRDNPGYGLFLDFTAFVNLIYIYICMWD